MKLLVAAGGTGGHIFPGISVAEAFAARKNCDVFFTGTSYGLEGKLIPAGGVYIVGFRHRGVRRFGMMNIGVRPTVSAAGTLMGEVHVLHFEGDLYGEAVTITFLQRLRDERKFGSVEELRRRLERDREETRRILAERTP